MQDELAGYRLLRLIGRGGSSEVWLARRSGSAAPEIAMKRLHAGSPSGAVAARQKEASLLAELDHPNLLPVLDVVEDPPGVALVLPLLRGGTLRGLLDRRGALPAGEVVALLDPVAGAIEALHRHGFVHGDLKPGNLLLTEAGVPVVADLGDARRIGDPAPPTSATPAYLDPAASAAAAAGASPGVSSSPAADVYALGVITYEALSGRLPHVGGGAEMLALAAAGVHRSLASWPGVDPAVAAVVERAIDATPSRRPAGPTAFLAELRAVVPSAEVRLPAPPPASAFGALDPSDDVTLAWVAPGAPEDPAAPDASPRAARVAATVGAIGVGLAAIGGAVALTVLAVPR